MEDLTATPPVEIETGPNPTASIIWLHGLGADGHDFEPIVPELSIARKQPLRFVFPHAPYRPVTLNNGYVMRAWYDIVAIRQGAPQDAEGIRASAGIVHDLIARERQRGIPSERLVLAGFSQGGAVVLHTSLRYPERLAGVLALSTYLPLYDKVKDERHPANADTPIFMAHGTEDPIVPLALGEISRDMLRTLGAPVDWRTYAMGHAVVPPEITDIDAWLQRILG